jgi:hypothetical protein
MWRAISALAIFTGYSLNSFRKRYLARFAGQLRTKIYGKMEPADLIPAHVYDRETGVLVWGLTLLAGLDSLVGGATLPHLTLNLT